jgi:hypothetical protein
LHPLLEDAQRLIHIVVAHENLQLALRSCLGFEDLLARFLRFTSHAGLRGFPNPRIDRFASRHRYPSQTRETRIDRVSLKSGAGSRGWRWSAR